MRFVLLASLVLAVACADYPCRSKTLFVALEFPESVTIATIDVAVRVDGGAPTTTPGIPIPSGAKSASFVVEFPAGYPQGKAVALSVIARDATGTVASGDKTSTLTGACERVELVLVATNAMTGDLLPTDAASADLATADLVESADLATSDDLAITLDLTPPEDLTPPPDLTVRPVTFGPAKTTTTGSQPIGMAVGDFDNNVFPDVAITNYQSPCNAVVYANSGSSTFTAAYTGPGHGMTASNLTRQPSYIAAADFNNDSRTDFVTVTYTPSGDKNVYVYLRDSASASFSTPVSYGSVGRPFGVATGKMNNDAFNDIIVLGLDSGLVDVLLNSGTGMFSSAGTVSCGGVCRVAAVGDFNHDTKTDLAVTSSSTGKVMVLLGDNTGGFSSAVPYATGGTPYGVITADFNHDTHLDLAVSNQADGTVSILLGDGAGAFGTATPLTVGMSPQGLDTADFNADGEVDIAVANYGAGSITLLLGRGDATFNPQTISTVSGPYRVIAADIDHDGKPDLVANGMGGGAFAVNLNTTP